MRIKEDKILREVIAKLPNALTCPHRIIKMKREVHWLDDEFDFFGRQNEDRHKCTTFAYYFTKSECGEYWLAPKVLTENFDEELDSLLDT